jgi:hypothetical protein
MQPTLLTFPISQAMRNAIKCMSSCFLVTGAGDQGIDLCRRLLELGRVR